MALPQSTRRSPRARTEREGARGPARPARPPTSVGMPQASRTVSRHHVRHRGMPDAPGQWEMPRRRRIPASPEAPGLRREAVAAVRRHEGQDKRRTFANLRGSCRIATGNASTGGSGATSAFGRDSLAGHWRAAAGRVRFELGRECALRFRRRADSATGLRGRRDFSGGPSRPPGRPRGRLGRGKIRRSASGHGIRRDGAES